MKTETLRIVGMSCGHCISAVEKALEELGATGQVRIGAAVVHYDDSRVTLDRIKDAIEDLGYDIAEN